MISDLVGLDAGKPRGKVFYRWSGEAASPMEAAVVDDRPQREPYDVAIVGAGVVGCALAFELSKYQLRVVVLEKKYDVGEGTSKANSALIHTGFDETPGSLESTLVTEAAREWPQLAVQLKTPLKQIGGLLLALDDQQARELPKLHERAQANGVESYIVDQAEVLQMEPHVTPSVCGGLVVPDEGIVDPFAVPIAFAELAVANGVDFLFGIDVVAVDDPGATVKKIVARQGETFQTRTIVNAAGLGSRAVANCYQGESFDINPRRGQFLIYDRNTLPLVQRVLLPVPTAHTKGKLVTPTIFGNLLAGPTAEDLSLDDPEATSTTVNGLAEVRAAAEKTCPGLAEHDPIASYAGARCHCAQGSYTIRMDDGGHRGILTITGVRSTGLTSSPTLASHVVERMVGAQWLSLTPDPAARVERAESCWPGWWKRPWEDADRIARQPDYGRMVCYCELISQQEIVDALESPLCPRTLDAIKRRSRVLTGRCQGFNCLIRTADIVGRHIGAELGEVTKQGPGSTLLPSVEGEEPKR